MSEQHHRRVAILGTGNMGEAVARGLVRVTTGKSGYQVICCDPIQEKLRALKSELIGIQIEPQPSRAVQNAEVLVLAVKPADVSRLIAEIRPELDRRKEPVTAVSVAAGVRVSDLKAWFGDTARVIRCMPNLPATIGAGVTAVFAESDSEWELAREILSSIGEVVRLASEDQIDVATAVSASGPAFLCLVLEALSEGGVQCGLPREISSKLALGMVAGTAQYLQKSGLHPALVREKVSSPRGTTLAGLAILEQAAVRASFTAAVEAAVRRARVLGESQSSALTIAKNEVGES